MNYSQLAFSDATKALQKEFGSRDAYEKIEKYHVVDGLSDNEIRFIENQDHFYMATLGDNGYPYIQHRGGPKGFVRVLDDHTLAFVDFSGNKQYISAGNIETNPNAALIMISYPHRARLKLFAKVRVVQLADEPELFAQINPGDYNHRPERMIVVDVQAYDWNCPQHITPRFTTAEIEQAFNKQGKRMDALDSENKRLKKEIENLKRKAK